jgi:hypothetical protein
MDERPDHSVAKGRQRALMGLALVTFAILIATLFVQLLV